MALKQIDPGIQIAAMAPGGGRTTVPHIVTFSGITATLAKVYRQPDEALRQSVHNAAMMRRDPMIMGPLLARQQAVALLPWSIVPEDEKDPELKRVASALEDIVRRTPRLTEYFRNLMEAIWYGKQAAQHGWGKTRDREGRAIRYIQRWVPLLGDKLVFRFDDGKGEFDPDQIGIKVTPAWARSNVVLGEPDLEYTSEGSAVFLNRWQRTRIAVHKHLVMDGDYIEPWSAGMIHGVGLRHFLYWCWFQKQETLAQLSEVVERTGMGFTIYFYPSGNERAKQEVTEIAEQQPNKNQIIMPFDASNPDAYRIEQIPPNTGGITALSHLVDDYFGNWIIRFILGQTLSMRADATGMGSGLSDLQKDSFLQIVRYDATNLEETLTTDLVQPLLLFNFPKYRNTRFFLKIATESSVPAEKLQAMQMAWSMGAKLRAQDVLDMVGASVAGEDDDTVWNPGVVGAMMQIQQAQEQEKQKQEQAEAQQGQQLPPEYQALLQGGLQPQQQAKRYFKGVDLPAANAQRSIKVTQDKNGWHAFDEATGVGAYLKDDGALHYTHGDPLDVKDEIEHHLMEAIRLASNPCDCEDPDDCDCDEQPTKYAAGEDEADEDEDDIEPDTTVWAEDVKPLHELGYQPVEKLSDAAWMNSDGELYSGMPTTRTKRHAGGVISKWDHWGVSDAFPDISSLVGNVKIDEQTGERSIESGRKKNSVRHYMTQTDSVLINQDPETNDIVALTSSGFTPGQLSMLSKHLNNGERVTIGLIDQNDANAKLLLKHEVRTPAELMEAVSTHARLLPRQTSPMEGVEIPEPPKGGSSAVPFLQGPEYKPPTGKTNMREVYTRAVSSNGRKDNPLSLDSESDRNQLAESLAHEAIFAMSKDGNAIEWYDKSLQAAIDKLASIDTGPNAEAFQALQEKDGDPRIMFKVFMALTSNMTAVAPNLKQAVELYTHWYSTRGKNGRGQIKPEFSLQGQAKKAFDKHKILLDEILDYFHDNPVEGLSPIASMERFLSGKFTNKQIGAMFPNLGPKATFNRYRVMVNGEQVGDIFKTSKEAKAAAKEIKGATVESFQTRERGKLKVSGELMEGLYSMLPGASVFGPKLGSFFNNLNGKFDTTTMDRWLMRTINRHRGIILDHNEEALKKQAVRLQKLLFWKDEKGKPVVVYKAGRGGDVKMTDRKMLKQHWDAVAIGMDALVKAGFTKEDLERDLATAAETGVIDRKGPAATFSSALHTQYKKDYNDKRQAFLAAKQLDLNLTQLREAPRKGEERASVRRVMERTRQLVKERTGKDVPEANLQALLWYLEKDLVSHSGLKLARQAATDFQMEAEKLYDQETGTTPEQGRLFHYERDGRGSGSAQRYARWDERGGVRGVSSSHSAWLGSLVGESEEKLPQVSSKSGQPQRNIAPLLAAVPALLGSLGGAGAAAGGAAAAGTAAAGGATAAGTMGAVGSSLGTIGNMASLGGMAMDVGGAAMGGLEKMASGRHYEPPRSVGDMPDQYAHDTDEWRSWAGEAADNVVEDFHPLSEEATPDRIQTGKPIVVKGYHGTPRGKIDQFDPGRRASTTGAASASIGDFHSGSKETAASYKSGDSYPEVFYSLSPERAGFAEDHVWRAKREWMDKNEDSPDYRKVGEMGSAAFLKYLHKKDPEHFETVSYGALQHAGHKGPVSLSFRRPALLENYVRMLNPYVHDHQGGRYKDADYYDIIRKAKAAGHDGVLILNTRDRNVDKDNNDPLSKDHIIVSFEPHQVKAASNKRPTNDPRLKYAEEQLPLDFGGDDEPSKAEPVEAPVSSPESSESSPKDFDVSKLDLQDGPLDDAESDLGTVADDPTLGATTETTKIDDPYVPPPGVSARPKDGPEVKEDQPTIDEPPAEAPLMSEGEQVASDEVGTSMPKAAAPEAPVKKKVEPLEGPVNQPPAAEQREDTTPLSDAGAVEQEQPKEPAGEQVEDWQLDDAEVQETDAEPPADETEPEAEPVADEAEPTAEEPADEAEAKPKPGPGGSSALSAKAAQSANNVFGLSKRELDIARDALKSGRSPGGVLANAIGSEKNYLKLESHLAKRYPDLLTGESGSRENRQVVAELLTGVHPEVDNAVEPAAAPVVDQPADDDAPLKMPGEGEEPAKGEPKQISVDLEERKRGKLEQQYLEGITAGGDATLSLGEGDKAVDYKQIPLDGGDIADMVVAAQERDPNFQLNGRDPSTVFWVNPATKEVKTIDEIRKEHGDELQKHLQVQHDAALAWHNEGQEIAKSFGFSPDKLNFDRKAAARLQDYTLKAAASAGLDLNKYPRDKQPEMARQFLNERREHISGFLQSAAEAGFPGGPSDNLLDGANGASQWLLASAMQSGWKPDAAEMKKGGITPKMAVSALQHIQQQKSKEMQGIQGLIKKMGGAKTLVMSLMAVAGVMMLLRSMSSGR